MKTKITITHESISELLEIMYEVIEELNRPINDEIGVENLPMTLGASNNSYFVEIKEG